MTKIKNGKYIIAGFNYYYKDNQFHREDGPAFENPNGSKEWYLEGKNYSEEEFHQQIMKRNLNLKLRQKLPLKLKNKRKKI